MNNYFRGHRTIDRGQLTEDRGQRTMKEDFLPLRYRKSYIVDIIENGKWRMEN
ncbi:hypothetical protein [Clostridium cochlearium]|uniref:hypothetical protein n=1 Tax=Clostridium cochlearium TaxID=1494 RepID=UPI002149EA70|nr:hypothetical protein [Clostridium cochlearium]MCR1971718.1 hypothetical protein [Clostridium cochlearium]